MPEEFDVSGDWTFPKHFIIRAVTLAREKGIDVLKKPEDQIGNEVCLTLNGVEIPVLETLETWEKDLDNIIERRAVELIKERCKDLFRKMDDMHEAAGQIAKAAENSLVEEFNQLGLKIKKDEYGDYD